MRFLETAVITVTILLFLSIAALGFFWGGVASTMVFKGSPVMEGTRPEAPAAGDTASNAQAGGGAAKAPAKAPAAKVVSAAAGEKVFKKCKACHAIAPDGKHKTGPNLWNVVGREVASAEGFDYSDAMVAHGGNWTVDALRPYLHNPKKAIPGNKMSFAGVKSDDDVTNLIAFLGSKADTPQDVVALGLSDTVVEVAANDAATEEEDEVVEIEPVPYPEGITYANAPQPTAEKQAAAKAKAAEIEKQVAAGMDYQRARYHPLHFSPNIENASNEECLACHKDILDHKPRSESIAGVPVDATLAWYQTLDTYTGPQDTFHYRHLGSDFAKEVMNLECTFCHKGNDPREETPDMLPTRDAFQAAATPEFTLRKMVNPSTTCLRCHGQFPYEVMDLEGPWHEIRADMEYPEAPNGCLSCHAEGFRTVRHQVSYLNSANIEKLAREGSSDTCYGCHGGRAWYRIAYPFPRHPWPDMDTEVPEWAVDRPTQSDPEYALPAAE